MSREQFPTASLADLYDPNTMPPVLVKAHQTLDKAVDLCYRSQPFINETKRIEFLFELFNKYTSGIFVTEKKFKIKKQIWQKNLQRFCSKIINTKHLHKFNGQL